MPPHLRPWTRHANQRRARSVAAAAFLIAASTILPQGARAAEDEAMGRLMERLDRLEGQLINVQSRLEARAAAPPAIAKPGEPLPPTAAARFELRVSQMETEVRRLTGHVEELNFTIQKTRERLDTLVSDVDQRLTALEGGAPRAKQAKASGTQQPAPPAQAAGAQPAATEAAGTGQAAAGAQLASLPDGPAEDQYRHARSFLVQGAYDEAEAALRNFIQAHPKHELSGNAQYWLGETYYVRKNYEDAVVAYLEGYQKYPKNQKAPDNLLKLGMSLANLGKKQEACATFTQLRQKFPKARSTIRKTAASQRKKLGC